jgi:ABC-type phosphate transport system auxiliary subunit
LDSDSTLFESQRQLVNTLLQERSRKFGEYDHSLQQKTGIFGLFKSKSDMQKSIDILQAIVINDNNIFIETRKLLDLKDTERERFQLLAKDFDDQVTAYMKTVSKLQQENDKLQQQIKVLQKDEHNSNMVFYVIALLIVGLLFVFYKLYRKTRVTKN